MAYTTIDKPSDYFNTKLYTGNGSTQSIDVGFQSDFTWLKSRTETKSHVLIDAVRGSNKDIISNSTAAENTDATRITGFDSDGFNLGSSTRTNTNSQNYVSWNWKAGTSFTNDASSTGIGSIDSAGSVNTDAGFSIITFTGTGSAGTVAHGLGAIPKFLVVKSRSNANGWIVYHGSLGAGKGISLNLTDAAFSTGSRWNSTEPTSTVFSLGTAADVNRSSGTHVCYAFAEKQGYSKFGSYTGNGSTDGVFCFTGFKPAFVLCKNTGNSGAQWLMVDNKRVGINPIENYVQANSSSAEATGTDNYDFLSNGFKCRSTNSWNNQSGYNIIYMAFAENPFVTSTGVPATAR